MKQMGWSLLAAVVGLAALAAEPHYAFRAELETVHESGLRDASLRPAENEFVFADGVAIVVPVSAGEVLSNAAGDFADYLSTSMDVGACVVKTPRRNAVSIVLDDTQPDRGYATDVDASGVRIRAKDERTAAQSLYHLEDLMNLRRAPYLRFGKETRVMRYSPRMAHSGWGMDLVPEKYLVRMAHAGFDALVVYVGGVGVTRGCTPFEDVRATIRRAKAHGLDVWLYMHKVKAFVAPDEPGAQKVFDEGFGEIAKTYPEAKGLILVGESCRFPSKDTRACSDPYDVKVARGDKRPNPGWFPCFDYPAWLRCVKTAVARHAPDMKVVLWTYNWARDWTPETPKARLELIDNIPHDANTVLLSTFERPDEVTLPKGFKTRVSDYTAVYPGPCRVFAAEAERAKANGLALFAMSNTGGRTWDYGTVPYEPCPYLWAKRWKALNESHAAWGLCGLMETHHYGWYPNFVSELAKEAYTQGGLPLDAHVRAIAARDFGEANADEVVGIWKEWSEREANHPPTRSNQYGPFRIGPAYPFNFGGAHIAEGRKPGCDFPDAPYASSGVEICHLNFTEPLWGEPMYASAELEPELELLRPLADSYLKGARRFSEMASSLQGRSREKARRMALLAEYSGRTVQTAINVKRGVLAFEKKDMSLLGRIARDEYANARATLPLVDADSSLGFECSMEYAGGREAIEWKLRKMEDLYGKTALEDPKASVRTAPREQVRIMSFNVCHCQGMDGKIDLERTARRIRAENPDFACLQEIDWRTARVNKTDQPAALALLTGLHATFARGIFFRGGQYGVTLLSRQKPLSVKKVPLPGKEPRVLLLCEFTDCWVGTTHLSVDGEQERLDSIAKIRLAVGDAARTKPVFLTGDWNATSDSAVLAGMRDFMTILSDTACQTFHGRQVDGPDGQPRDMSKFCIDYIAVDSLHAADFEMSDAHVVPDRETSDHAPIVVTAETFVPTLPAPAVVPAPTELTLGKGVRFEKASAVSEDIVRFEEAPDVQKEGYELFVKTDGITVRASTAAGRFYALQTLEQLAVPRLGKLAFPCLTIRDAPRFGWRGVHFDDSRHFFGKAAVKRTLDLMAFHKLNVLHWHLTDDEGWRFPVARHPELTRDGSSRPYSKRQKDLADRFEDGTYGPFAYSGDDIREVVAYAAARHIRIVPEIDVPGHSRTALAVHPEFLCFPKGVGGAPQGAVDNVFCLGNDASLELIDDVFESVCALFPSEIIHIGGDEVNKVNWESCPKCRARMKALGLKDGKALQSWQMNRLAASLAKRGRRVMGWDEMILDGKAPSNSVVMSWRGAEGGRAAAALGIESVMTPHDYCYFDYEQCLKDDPAVYPWFTHPLPLAKAHSYEPLEGIPPEQHRFVLGGQCCNWAEFTCNETELQWKMWPRACATAEVFWSPVEKRDLKDFAKRMETHRNRLLNQGVNCAPLEGVR